MQNNNEPTNKLEELESACEETKISSIAKKKQKLAQDEDLLENEIIEEKTSISVDNLNKIKSVRINNSYYRRSNL